MRKSIRLWILPILFWAIMAPAAEPQPEVPTPLAFFGFEPGADRSLFDYEALIAYLQKLDQASSRIKMIEIGRSPMGRPMYVAFISAEKNIENLESLREINQKLALRADLAESERTALIARGRVFLLATLSMHSSEVAPAQSAPLIAHELAISQDPAILSWLDAVVLMLVPTHNPDGMDMVVEHYRKYKKGPYEGAPLPGVYHKYVGHDNNRDYVTLTQEDTRAISALYSTSWFPQVMVDKHQMSADGPRYFVPPVHDPIAENLDAGLYNWTKIFGAHMVTDMTERGLTGISQSYAFDFYWPGPTETSAWKNVIALLTEMASCKIATPVYVEPNELDTDDKGLAEYKKSINMPALWPGGWWRLGDMVQYEVASFHSLLKTAARYREELLTFRNDLCRREVELGHKQAPYYYLIPRQQHDAGAMVDLINLLFEHGIRIYSLEQTTAIANRTWEAGTLAIPLAQPFRAFIKEMLEKQEYPVRRYTPNGEILKPYDITSWSLPLHSGVESVPIMEPGLALKLQEITRPFTTRAETPGQYALSIWPVENNAGFRAAFLALREGLQVGRLTEPYLFAGRKLAAGSFLIYPDRGGVKFAALLQKLPCSPCFASTAEGCKAEPLKMPRIALVETWFQDMDAGWTRYVLDSYAVPFAVIHPGEFEKTDFAGLFDVVVFPDADKSILMEGKYKNRDEYMVSEYPPEFARGIGKAGFEKLMTFLDQGGKIVSWGRSTELFMGKLEITRGKEDKQEFQLPVRNIAESASKDGLYCPGSLIRTHLAADHPLSQGMPGEVGVFYRGRPIFTTSIPSWDMDRRVIGWFPEKDLLLSGYIEKEEKLANKTNLVWLRKGEGQLVLFAFNPQYRAATPATYKLLFNALLLNR
jgi:hypothetical protein